ncbi:MULTISPECIES: sulfurtransferase [unclassified Chelatococcus]|uniref:sulfurtransferase n=1 Tax=unclassified Chelatococcus TaxID=2638111 RepID=UPI001BCE0725|nr:MULTISPECIES: sulfurtransferase [unclassified Chelatococcus]CAH1653580.1 putative thiosulfate sulfurtransferase SseB [Hyphomicrobiales bacterium]MBS7742883.1 sulfurtransferase [Chelatococcus sp. HY11]MBX3541999.1 sulfurtransferase [Chelatococcus sp.]MCO5074109.1 sulfurtransferase [Chelatococcus sp.]CAH1694503.1 putative thiosulfate sulfurtransferase SseB [Hyphomicrobiales bacterium]
MSTTDAALRARNLITVEELGDRIDRDERIVLLDIRFRLGQGDGRQDYLDGHIPGAVFVDLPHELAGDEYRFSGRRPLPDVRTLERDARRWGIRKGDAVVVYDNNSGQQAARAWWVLRWAGIATVRLLDGGLAAWIAAGRPVTREVPLPARGDVELEGGHLPVLTAELAAQRAQAGVLLDARDAQSYRGTPVQPGKPPEGHIPGALSAPTTANLGADGLFKPASALRERFEGLGIAGGRGRVGVYCGGGVTATHQVLALSTIGIEAELFVGSWSAWSSDPSRSVATGDDPQ